MKMNIQKYFKFLLAVILCASAAQAADMPEETFLHLECFPDTGILSIKNGLSLDRLPEVAGSEKLSKANGIALNKRGYYSVQKTSGKHTCKLGTDTYSFFITYHPSRERGECAAAEFWSLWLETPEGGQFVYTLDGYACFPGQPLLKSLRLESTPTGRILNVCSSEDDEDIDGPTVCKTIPIPRKGG